MAKEKRYCTDEPCTACGAHTEGGSALHHVKTRKAGGTDHPWNLMPLCFKCHHYVHSIGLVTFSKLNPPVRTWLVLNEWSICELTGKWYHSKEAEYVNRQNADEDPERREIQ